MERSDIDGSKRDVPQRGVSGGEHQTPVRYLVPGSGKASRGYLWVANDPQGSLFYHWGVGRGCDRLVETIGGKFSGHIQCDGYGVYKTYAKANPRVSLIAYLAHIRRNFVEVIEAAPDPNAARILNLIGELYGVEKDLRITGASHTQRQSNRVKRSTPLIEAIGEVMEATLAKHRPKSLMGKALAYGLGHWRALARYLENGRFEIDNNLVENAVRPVKLGAKNWLFFGSKEAGHNAAIIFTLVENCRRHGVPVEAYLRELLTRLPSLTNPETVARLTPSKIAAIRHGKSAAA